MFEIARRALGRAAAIGVFAGACIGFAAPVAAQASGPAASWPQRNVQFILPFGAGSATDIAARMLAERLQAKWGRPVVVENRPGGDGLIAIRSFLSANDDHVLLYASSASFIAHPYTLTTKVPYDLDRDLNPIARVADTLLSIAAPSAMNVSNLKEWTAAARAAPGKLNAAGAPGLPDLALNAFIRANKLEVARVPYKDIVQAGVDLAESRIHILVTSYAIALPHLRSGRARVIAVGSSERSPILPDAPTATESGFPILTTETTSGLYGPAGMPLELRKRIAADVNEATRDPVVSKRLIDTGQSPNPQGPAELAKALERQKAAAARIAEAIGIEAKR
jgi:tripartite-type tricarboxylate transporter receptor subunit TctC